MSCLFQRLIFVLCSVYFFSCLNEAIIKPTKNEWNTYVSLLVVVSIPFKTVFFVFFPPLPCLVIVRSFVVSSSSTVFTNLPLSSNCELTTVIYCFFFRYFFPPAFISSTFLSRLSLSVMFFLLISFYFLFSSQFTFFVVSLFHSFGSLYFSLSFSFFSFLLYLIFSIFLLSYPPSFYFCIFFFFLFLLSFISLKYDVNLFLSSHHPFYWSLYFLVTFFFFFLFPHLFLYLFSFLFHCQLYSRSSYDFFSFCCFFFSFFFLFAFVFQFVFLI